MVDNFVAVIPEGVRALANRLNDLASALTRFGPTITQTMSDWELPSGGLDYSPLNSANIKARQDDASSMAQRADLAQQLQDQTTTPWSNQQLLSPGGLPKGMVQVPWLIGGTAFNNEGAADAANLKAIMEHGDPNSPTQVEELTRIAQTLDDHMHDKPPSDYLQGFYGQGGQQMLWKVPSLLQALYGNRGYGVHIMGQPPQDGLNATGQQLMTSFANAFAGDTANGTITWAEPPKWEDATAQDLALGQFMKYGPDGSQWGTQFLTDASNSVFADANKYVDRNGKPTQDQIAEAWNPSLMLLVPNLVTRLGQNSDASFNVMTGSDGLANAQVLAADRSWVGDGLAAVIANATTSAAHTHDDMAPAAANIIQAFGSQDSSNISPALAQALAGMSTEFLPDLANSAYIFSPNTTTMWDPSNHKVDVSMSDMSALLRDMAGDQDATNAFTGIIANVTQAQVDANTRDSQARVGDLAALQALFLIQQQNVGIDKAAAHDHQNQVYQNWADFALGFANSTPIALWGPWSGGEEWDPAKGETAFQQTTGSSSSLMGMLFPTDNQANAEAQAQVSLAGAYSALDVPIVQSLINNNKIPQSDLAGQPWFQDGQIVINTKAEQDAFDTWTNQHRTTNGNGTPGTLMAYLDAANKAMGKVGYKWNTD